MWKMAAIVAALVVVAGLLVYSGGMENILKLLGVGASGIYDVTLSSNRHFIGDAKFFVDGSRPGMEGVSVFDQFTGTPSDPNANEQGKGFVAPIFSSPQDPTQESYKEHYYASPVIDLTLATPLLSAIEVTEFAPEGEGATIEYAYRSAAQPSALLGLAWQPVDPSVLNSETDNIKVRTAVIEQNIERYAQIKFTFVNPDPMQRSAVYAASFQYKDGSEVSPEEGASSAGAVERDIAVSYGEVNAPTNADIDVLSPQLDNKIVYSQKQIDLSQRVGYTFRTALAAGAYALVVSSPTTETIIMPFEAGSLDQITVNLGSFAPPTGQDSAYDLNGDGVVNTIDLQLLMSKFTP